MSRLHTISESEATGKTAQLFSALKNSMDTFRKAGFSDQQVIDIIGAVSAIPFTNMVNRVNDTVVDFPKVN